MDYYEEAFKKNKNKFKVGDIYIDGAGHPTLCIFVHIEEKDIGLEGISLFDGTYPRGCSVLHTAPDKISYEEAWKIKVEHEKGKRIK